MTKTHPEYEKQRKKVIKQHHTTKYSAN